MKKKLLEYLFLFRTWLSEQPSTNQKFAGLKVNLSTRIGFGELQELEQWNNWSMAVDCWTLRVFKQ